MSVDANDPLFRRDGRLSDLTLEQLLADELDAAQRATVEAHLATHPADQQRVAAARGHQAAVSLRPRPAKVLAFPARAALGVTLALAAGAALWLLRPSTPAPTPIAGPIEGDGIRVKSGTLDFEVFVHDGQDRRKVDDGAQVRPGDRVGFRVKARGEGHLLVAGIDEAGDPYPCWPQGAAPAAAPWRAQAPVVLDRAMRLDDTPGAERFVAVRCDQAFDFSTVRDALTRARADQWRAPPALPEGCTVRVVRLEKH